MGVHLLLLQTFSHVAGIQLKAQEAGDRSSQVKTAWILQTTASKSGGFREGALSSYQGVRLCDERTEEGRDGEDTEHSGFQSLYLSGSPR